MNRIFTPTIFNMFFSPFNLTLGEYLEHKHSLVKPVTHCIQFFAVLFWLKLKTGPSGISIHEG